MAAVHPTVTSTSQRPARAPGLYVEAVRRPAASEPRSSGITVIVGFGHALDTGGARTEAFHPNCRILQGWSAQDFDRKIRPAPGSFLRAAVRGFFANGGRRCAVWLIDPDASAGEHAGSVIRALRPEGLLHDLDANLLCMPDCVSDTLLPDDGSRVAIQQALLEHCSTGEDRFAILDTPRLPAAADPVEALAYMPTGIRSGYGALYFPWIFADSRSDGHDVADMEVKRSAAARWRCMERDGVRPSYFGASPLPPSAHVAGMFAYLDEHFKAARAPAGFELLDALDVDRYLSPGQQGALTDARVNCITTRNGHGIRVMGARTLSGHESLAYVSTVRVVVEFRRWVITNLSDLVFEPQTPTLWDRIRRRLTGHCMDLWRAGALAGADALEAFSIECDAATNPPDSLERGQVVANVSLAPTVPAEFIKIQVVHGAGKVAVNAT